MVNGNRGHHDAATALEGAELYQVVFVRDYVQLGFHSARADDSDLILSVLSVVHVASNGVVSEGIAEPRALTDRIGSFVQRPAIDDERIELSMTDGSRLEISLRAEDFVGPEAAVLKSASAIWVF